MTVDTLPIQDACQLGAGDSASDINRFADRHKPALTRAPHKKAPACAFEWRHLPSAAARPISSGPEGTASTPCDCWRTAASGPMARLLLFFGQSRPSQ